MLNSSSDEYKTVWVDPDSIQEEIDNSYAEENIELPKSKGNRWLYSHPENKVFGSLEEAVKNVSHLYGSVNPTVKVTKDELETLLNGGVLAIDVFEEYKVFLNLQLDENK